MTARDGAAAPRTHALGSAAAFLADDLAAERRRTAGMLRRLIALTVDGNTDRETLSRLARALDAVMGSLPDHPTTSRYAGTAGRPEAVYLTADTHPVGGGGNPVAVPFAFEAEGDTVRARLRFGAAHEGTPGVVHGGMVAATFDHLLGAAAIRAGRPIVTGTLTVRYRQPTPIDTDLVFEGRAVDVVGRKVRVAGTVRADGAVTAEADALFIAVDATRYVPVQ